MISVHSYLQSQVLQSKQITPTVTPKQPDAIPKNQDPFQSMTEFVKGVQNGKQFTFRELLYYQVQSQKGHFHVEAITRAAEGVSSLVKRLQQTQ